MVYEGLWRELVDFAQHSLLQPFHDSGLDGFDIGRAEEERASAGVHSISMLMVVFMTMLLFGPSTVRRFALKAADVGVRQRRRGCHG